VISVKGDEFYLGKKEVELAGSHTWNNVQPFNGKTVSLDTVTGNFTRLWTIETRKANFADSPWGSNTEGLISISDGPWKKDGSLNRRYYDRMETVVKRAENRDLVTGVILFEGSIQRIFGGAWENHPFNGLGPKRHEDIHSKGKWNKYQRAHVKELVTRLEPHDNVVYEVGNELARESVPWFQRKVIQWVRKFTDKPVGVSYASGRYDNRWMTNMDADFIVPGNGAKAGGVRKVAGFKGPQILDTDHSHPLVPRVSSLQTAWRDGRPLWLMDGLDGSILRNQGSLVPDRSYINSIV